LTIRRGKEVTNHFIDVFLTRIGGQIAPNKRATWQSGGRTVRDGAGGMIMNY
jgi:hypothetical protein